ncbi:histone-lysine N-methyltransferase SETMAR-like [Drosophila suzukii]|uniref:Histone-lysine N-methyltransferase SETMAR-like n=1 Tax=Drosophila suzukii TaxID=28584 RepID=A0ABM4TN14_DROSZ
MEAVINKYYNAGQSLQPFIIVEGLSPDEIRGLYISFNKVLLKYSSPGKSTIKDWYNEFKRGRVDTKDAERSGRPRTAVTPENVAKIRKMVLADRKLKLKEIADASKISEGSVFTILHEHLDMRKLCSKWVPRLLTPDQKHQRIDASETCLSMLKRNRTDFFRRYVTMDETWIHHYTPESSRQSSEWVVAGESRPKRPKTQISAGKTINSENYIKLLDRLDRVIKEKRPHMAKKKPLFHQDNAPCHKSMATMVKLSELRFELLPHPPYSPDMAPSDYWLFSYLKKHLQGKRYRSNEEVIVDTETYFEGKSSSFYKNGIERLEKRWTECIAVDGNCIDE